MSSEHCTRVLESCQKRFQDALATQPRIDCVFTEKSPFDPSEPRLPGRFCGMTLTIVKFCSYTGGCPKKFELYFRPKQDDPPDYFPGQTFSQIATDAGAALLSLPPEWHAWIWAAGRPPSGPDVCALWLAAVSDLAIFKRYPTLHVDRWTWAGKELIDRRLIQYHPAMKEIWGTTEEARIRAYSYPEGAFLDDIYWKSAEACRIIRALLSSSLTVDEIRLLQGMVGVGFPYSAPGGDVRLGSGEEEKVSIQGLAARLKDMGLVDCVQGRRSLSWATPKGWRLATGLID